MAGISVDSADGMFFDIMASFVAVLLMVYVVVFVLLMRRIVSLWMEKDPDRPCAFVLEDYVEDVSSEQAICSICLCSDRGSSRTKLPCGHVFHKECLTQWWCRCKSGNAHLSCPLCRRTYGVEVLSPLDETSRGICVERHAAP
ncbi:PJA2 [Symbiodinium sp. CCMP2456]|nr:PJA2 [Symbiodinium sp. CCMP2456]